MDIARRVEESERKTCSDRMVVGVRAADRYSSWRRGWELGLGLVQTTAPSQLGREQVAILRCQCGTLGMQALLDKLEEQLSAERTKCST
jgi:hypothetical protein